MTLPSFDRRRFLAGAAMGAPALLLHGRALAATDPFSLGVASGEPEPDGFVIWTRIAPNPLAEDGLGGNGAPMPVRWEIRATTRSAISSRAAKRWHSQRSRPPSMSRSPG